MGTTALLQPRRRGLQSLASIFVSFFERYMPDPFVSAIRLIAATTVLILLIAPKSLPAMIVTIWYGGIFAILGFAFQIILILATGHALSHAPMVVWPLRRVRRVDAHRQPDGRAHLPGGGCASLLNWSLMVSAILAREAVRQVWVDCG